MVGPQRCSFGLPKDGGQTGIVSDHKSVSGEVTWTRCRQSRYWPENRLLGDYFPASLRARVPGRRRSGRETEQAKPGWEGSVLKDGTDGQPLPPPAERRPFPVPTCRLIERRSSREKAARVFQSHTGTKDDLKTGKFKGWRAKSHTSVVRLTLLYIWRLC